MKTTIIAAGLLALTLPAAAFAQEPGCVRQNQDNRAAGTVLGAVGGALLGGAIAGNGHKGDGAIAGAVAGGVAGNVIAGSNNHPCPQGYVYVERRDGPPPPPPPRGPRDFWYGAPQGVEERIAFMQDRVDRSIRGGWLSRREARDITDEMGRVRLEDRRLRRQDGGELRPVDRDYIFNLLSNLSARLHWAEHN